MAAIVEHVCFAYTADPAWFSRQPVDSTIPAWLLRQRAGQVQVIKAVVESTIWTLLVGMTQQYRGHPMSLEEAIEDRGKSHLTLEHLRPLLPPAVFAHVQDEVQMRRLRRPAVNKDGELDLLDVAETEEPQQPHQVSLGRQARRLHFDRLTVQMTMQMYMHYHALLDRARVNIDQQFRMWLRLKWCSKEIADALIFLAQLYIEEWSLDSHYFQ